MSKFLDDALDAIDRALELLEPRCGDCTEEVPCALHGLPMPSEQQD